MFHPFTLPCNVIYYQDPPNLVPVLLFLDDLAKLDHKAHAQCLAAINLLRERGHLLQRPASGTLPREIHELRVKVRKVNYRILYGFAGQQIAVLAHAITKTDTVPAVDINRAADRLLKFRSNPTAHTYKGKLP